MPRFPVLELLGAQYRLRMVRQGNFFALGHRYTIPANETRFLEGRFASNRFVTSIARTFVTNGPNVTVDLLENPTIGTPGTTAILIHNLNRNSTKVAQTQAFSDPASVTGGTVIDSVFLPGSGTGVGQAAGSVVQEAQIEQVLKLGTPYVLRIINGNNASVQVQVTLLFYEVGIDEFQS